MRAGLTLSGPRPISAFPVAANPAPPNIPDEWVRDLAAAGALCERCGGVHLVSIDQLVLALAARQENGVEVPWCTCREACSACGPFLLRTAPAIAVVLRERREIQPR